MIIGYINDKKKTIISSAGIQTKVKRIKINERRESYKKRIGFHDFGF